MKSRQWTIVVTSLMSVLAIGLAAPTPGARAVPVGGRHIKPTPTPTPPANIGTYVRTYANVLNSVQQDVTPVDVSVTSDGGAVALALSSSSTGTGLSWLVKLDNSGNPQWQTELGCFNLPPGDYADAVSIQQTTDGGYVVAGGTIGCGSGSSCPSSSGIQCGLVEKLDASGKMLWAYVYPAGSGGSSIKQIRQTSDGGYIAVGSTTDTTQNTGALILKLSSQGIVQWQRELGPSAGRQGYLDAVQGTSDGGYVAAGEFYTPTTGSTPESVLVVKLNASGTVQWQRAFNNLNAAGTATSTEGISSILATQDGGYLVAGHWSDSTFPGECCGGALLLKLDATGAVQWQKAYIGANSGGVYCYDNGYSETCTDIGAVIYSVHQTSDGGYVLAGDGDLELQDSVPLVPWLAKVDASGNLLWQHFYYQVNQATGRPLSEYFASSSPTSNGGTVALGWTENYSTLKGELYGVKTDSTGMVGICPDLHGATSLTAINPGLVSFSSSLSVGTTITGASASPSGTSPTSVSVQADC